mmetsp:Transcript_100794/g.284255  ORF Transcript_100794/g.284255 Transcript_100794/m.284255 type:complete len:247 (+) Transcript_100794:882-1622(+)
MPEVQVRSDFEAQLAKRGTIQDPVHGQARHDPLRERPALLGRQALDDAPVEEDGSNPLGRVITDRLNEKVAWVWISMNQALLECEHCKCLHEVASHGLSVGARRKACNISDLETLDETHRQHTSGAVLEQWFATAYVQPAAPQRAASVPCVLSLEPEINLFAGRPAPLLRNLCEVWCVAVQLHHEPQEVLQCGQIRAHELCDTTVLHLQADLLAIRTEARDVRLGDARGSHRLLLEVAKELLQRAA